MEKILLEDLPKRKDLIGKTINVIRQGGKYNYDYQNKPMLRKFLGARFYKENNKLWLRWEWQPKTDVNGHTDCGYSGIGLWKDNDKDNLFDNSYLLIA